MKESYIVLKVNHRNEFSDRNGIKLISTILYSGLTDRRLIV